MKFDFIASISKQNIGSSKWEWMNQKAKNNKISKKELENIIPLSVADMEFKLPKKLKKSLINLMENDHLGYTKPTKRYFKAVKDWLLKRHDFKVENEWIIPTPGVVFGLHTAIKAFTKKGDGVIIMTPVYYPFYSAILNNDRKVIKNELIYKNKRYEINFKDLRNKVKKAKALILCSPHNPVGRVWSKDELKKIGEICLENDVLVLSDEIHMDIIMSGFKHTVFATLGDKFAKNSVIFTAPSKSFNIAGLQCSNLIIKNKNLRKKFNNELNKVGYHSLNAFAYEALIACYEKCDKWLDEAIKVIETNKNLVTKFIKKSFLISAFANLKELTFYGLILKS